MSLETEAPKWTADRGVVANPKRGVGCVLFAAPGSYLEHETDEFSGRLDDMGLDDAPFGISVWEGHYAGGGSTWHTGDYEDCYPVGTFRPPTDDEWTAIREGRNPFGEAVPDEPIVCCPGCGNEIDPDVCHCGDYAKDHGGWDSHAPVPMGCTCGQGAG
ncbi:MAG TPA: hypothetical protein VG994_02610 [Steroidobacteraceae bacterium]|nr:hypothetical protein [Steroidobacteraceae bacterium]